LALEAPSAKPGAWVHQLFGDAMLRLCGLGTLILLFMPADGIPGVELCYFRSMSGLPCPGCGLTRSGAHLLRGHLAQSIGYHPFGLLIFPPMVVLALVGLAPRPWREAVRRELAERRWGLEMVFWVVGVSLIIFGLVRCFWVWQGRVEFPTVWL
jgi:hypothetical protein